MMLFWVLWVLATYNSCYCLPSATFRQDGTQCDTTNYPVYQNLSSVCPLMIDNQILYYHPMEKNRVFEVTYYYQTVVVKNLKCDTACELFSTNSSKGSPSHNNYRPRRHSTGSSPETRYPRNPTVRSTVIHDLPTLAQLFHTLTRQVLPMCTFEQDSVGHWVPRELWSRLWDVVHPPHELERKVIMILMLDFFLSRSV